MRSRGVQTEYNNNNMHIIIYSTHAFAYKIITIYIIYILYVCLCACNVFNSLLVLNAHRHRLYLCVHAIPTPTDGFKKKNK